MRKKTLFIALIALLWNSCAKDGTEKRCDKGFTGKNCDQEIVPSKIQVTRLEVSTLPALDLNGSTWDPLGGKPDVYLKIVDQSSNVVIYTSGTVQDHNLNLGVYSDMSSSNILMNHPTGKYTVEAWDYDDLDADDFMGGIEFTPYHEGERFPSQINLSCQGCNTSWKLDFTYLY